MGEFSKLSLQRSLPHHFRSVNCPHGMPPFLFSFMMVLFRSIEPIPQKPVEQADHSFHSDKMQSGLTFLGSSIAFVKRVSFSFDDSNDFLGSFRLFLLRWRRRCECWSCLCKRKKLILIERWALVSPPIFLMNSSYWCLLHTHIFLDFLKSIVSNRRKIFLVDVIKRGCIVIGKIGFNFGYFILWGGFKYGSGESETRVNATIQWTSLYWSELDPAIVTAQLLNYNQN